MIQAGNIAGAFIERARAQPEATAFVAGGKAISYGRTVDLMVHFARRMQGLGITPRSLVGLATNDLPTATVTALAVALLGGRWTAMSSNAAAVYPGMTHLLTTVAPQSLPGSIEIDRHWANAPELHLEVPAFPGHSSPDDPWMITSSSGTTGMPKFIAITYETLWRRVENPDLQDGRAPTTLMLFAPTSYVGIRNSLCNLVHGGTNLGRAPFDDMMSAGLNRVLSSPSQVSSVIFDRLPPPARRIRCLRATGSRVTSAFVANALRYFEEVEVLYGATEFGAATLLRITDPAQVDGSVGHPYAGAQVEVVDELLAPVPAGSEGTVRVHTPWTVAGYLDQPALTAELFRDGWFYPGDRGFLDPGGALHITGRTNDVLNVGGTKFNAAALDELIQLHPDVADGFCFVSSTERGSDIVSAMVTLRPGTNPQVLHALRASVAAKLGRPSAPRRAYVVGAMPRNENGKPMRTRASELAETLTPIELADA